MSPTGECWQLGRRPALDGLRGIAISLVLVEHAHIPGVPRAGVTGVTVFFTLSGFLITSLLLEEVSRRGRVDLAAFYRRRALRLFPALTVFVAVVALFGIAIGSSFVTPVDVAGTVSYLSNWLTIIDPQDSRALAHTWSLAIEEQFYIFWPLVMLLPVQRRWLAVAAIGGAAVSLALRLAMWDGGDGLFRVYIGSDTRADGLLIGCVLALALKRRPERRVSPLVGLAGMLGIGAACMISDQWAGYVIVPTAAALCTVLTIYGSVNGDRATWLGVRPLLLIGQRSYGLYLWHFPVSVMVAALDGSWVTQLLVMVPVAWVLALLSWRFVEQPFLGHKSRGTHDNMAETKTGAITV